MPPIQLASLCKVKQDFFNMERRNKSYSWEERGGHQESRSSIGKEKEVSWYFLTLRYLLLPCP